MKRLETSFSKYNTLFYFIFFNILLNICIYFFDYNRPNKVLHNIIK